MSIVKNLLGSRYDLFWFGRIYTLTDVYSNKILNSYSYYEHSNPPKTNQCCLVRLYDDKEKYLIAYVAFHKNGTMMKNIIFNGGYKICDIFLPLMENHDMQRK